MESYECTLLIDSSFSMDGIKHEVDTAVSRFLARLRGKQGALLTMASFANEYEILYQGFAHSAEWDPTRYSPFGGTALLDAMAHGLGAHTARLRQRGTVDGGLFCVVTDGEENMSVRYKQNFGAVFTMVERARQEHGTRFVFLGLDEASVVDAMKMGMRDEEIHRVQIPADLTRLLPASIDV